MEAGLASCASGVVQVLACSYDDTDGMLHTSDESDSELGPWSEKLFTWREQREAISCENKERSSFSFVHFDFCQIRSSFKTTIP